MVSTPQNVTHVLGDGTGGPAGHGYTARMRVMPRLVPGVVPVTLASGPPRSPGTTRRSLFRLHDGRAASSGQPAQARRTAGAGSVAVLALEAIGSLLMWAPMPLAWLWVGGRVYAATGSLAADGGVAFLGFVATTALTMAALNRLDGLWVALRRRAGHAQPHGALNQVVVVSATLGILLFLLWFYILQQAFVLPFMPSQ